MNKDIPTAATTIAEEGTQTKTAGYKRIGLFLGPSVLLLMTVIGPIGELSLHAWLAGAITLWIAIWWATEAIPIPVTALLPLVLFPIMDVEKVETIAGSYTSPVVYLLIGGFILALGLQRWSLHRRIALYILSHVSSTPGAVVWGFMLATALLSMWVSNTATTLMMVPIATSVALTLAPNQEDPQHQNFTIVLLLAVAYAASIGGLGTLVGTPPNLLMAGFLYDQYDITIGFVDWMMFGMPLVVVMLPAAWWVLIKFAFPIEQLSGDKLLIRTTIATQYRSLGKTSQAEKRMAVVFLCVVVFWMLRKWIVSITGLEGLSDTSIAITGAVLLFILPSGQGKPLMDWGYAKQLPWDIVLLYGGGMALATAITSSGLAASFGHAMELFSNWHLLALIVVITAVVVVLTELTNNSATIATFMPILGILSVSAEHSPLQLAAPAALAASCAFMLPVATPPNAVVFGTGLITLPQMARAGLLINLLGLLLIPVIAYTMLPLLL